MHTHGEAIDLVTLGARLPAAGDQAYISELTEVVSTTEHISIYIERLIELYRQRELLTLSHTISTCIDPVNQVSDTLCDRIQEKIEDLPKIEGVEKLVFKPGWNNKPQAIKTVLSLVGTRILSPGNISVLISQPGTGKSSICEAILAKS